jgi:hypothetical protein
MPGLKLGNTSRMLALSVMFVALAGGDGVLSAADAAVRIADSPPAGKGNAYYAGNRAPLLPSPLIKLPVGAVRPAGWLRTQLELQAEGFIGHLPELSAYCDFENSAWTQPGGKGERGWEEAPYWLRGYISMGYILEDQRIIDESRRWVEAVLAHQWDNGYFGPEANYKNHDYWPNMIMLYVLRTFHEATGDPRVLAFMTRYFEYHRTVPLEKLYPRDAQGRTWWQGIRGADKLDSIHWLYNHAGTPWLLDVARVNHERTQDWTGGIPSWHGVNITQCYRGPAQYYQQTRDRRYLQSTLNRYATVMEIYGQVPGGMFGADEVAREGYIGPRQAAETCSMVEFMYSHQMMARITGDPLWADQCEEIAFNSLPCSMSPDLKGLQYLTAPNSVQLDRTEKHPMIERRGQRFSYNPHTYRCCQHNVSHGWPYFAENLWMATGDNGLAAVLYAAGTVTARVGDGTEVMITTTTDYPFSETVDFRLDSQAAVAFPLVLRIPAWCETATVQVNGQQLDVQAGPRAWVVIERTWAAGDTVRLELPMAVSLKVWEANRKSVSVNRGPLTYSLRIGERWEQYNDDPKWPGFEVFPTTPWNYGLIFDAADPAGSFEVVKSSGPPAAQPFTVEDAPILLRAKGRRIADWVLEDNGLIGPVPESPVASDAPTEDIVLIPMGCARLRVSAFPWIGP